MAKHHGSTLKRNGFSDEDIQHFLDAGRIVGPDFEGNYWTKIPPTTWNRFDKEMWYAKMPRHGNRKD